MYTKTIKGSSTKKACTCDADRCPAGGDVCLN